MEIVACNRLHLVSTAQLHITAIKDMAECMGGGGGVYMHSEIRTLSLFKCQLCSRVVQPWELECSCTLIQMLE